MTSATRFNTLNPPQLSVYPYKPPRLDASFRDLWSPRPGLTLESLRDLTYIWLRGFVSPVSTRSPNGFGPTVSSRCTCLSLHDLKQATLTHGLRDPCYKRASLRDLPFTRKSLRDLTNAWLRGFAPPVSPRSPDGFDPTVSPCGTCLSLRDLVQAPVTRGLRDPCQ